MESTNVQNVGKGVLADNEVSDHNNLTLALDQLELAAEVGGL